MGRARGADPLARRRRLWHVGDVTAEAAPTAVPRDWSAEPADVLLADGTIAVIRSLHEDDRDAVLELHESVSVDTLRLRFFSPSREAGRLYVDHLFAPDNTGSAALVALVRGRVAGLATAELLSPDSAEVAFLVADQDRGRGLGSLLLEHLAALGRRHGVSRFEAEVLGDNYGMLRVFRAAGFAATRRSKTPNGTLQEQGHVIVIATVPTSLIHPTFTEARRPSKSAPRRGSSWPAAAAAPFAALQDRRRSQSACSPRQCRARRKRDSAAPSLSRPRRR